MTIRRIANAATARWRCRCCSKTHQPLDLVIIMLGTNDLKFAAAAAPSTPVGMERLIEIVQTFPYNEDYTKSRNC